MQTKRSAADLSAIQADGKSRSVRMLAAYMDLGARYKMVGKQQRASAELRGLRIETRVTLGEEKVQAPQITLCNKAALHDSQSVMGPLCAHCYITAHSVEASCASCIPALCEDAFRDDGSVTVNAATSCQHLQLQHNN